MMDLRERYPGYFGAKLDATPPPGGYPQEFWVITACDPNGEELDPHQNAERTVRFEAELSSAGLVHFPVTGYDPDGIHREPGFGIICDAREAMCLGRKWEQVAVFHIKDGEGWLVFCSENEERFHLRTWEEMAGG
ncbi:DUF3293 domain-containing protein [Luteolibacter sp. SL250]|uniref:DUF3293 domain-containing protein n=1 Tax=Luteolibacter sp. SL250 TaxID=2995170 RepID=UPI00226E3F10|nr:DUF3293 domain-containing protein [Luteolibacter sp. SL250]WAC17746.1 DUF3293 domain-containing protein [Luteolibacter sp. SL250]